MGGLLSQSVWDWRYLAGVPFTALWSEKRMARFRDQRFSWVVQNAAGTIPFYKDLLEKYDVDPAAIRGVADRRRLPVMTKEQLREAGQSAWADNVPKSQKIVASTSGSSGDPLVLFYRLSDRLRKHAINLDSVYRCGWRPWHRGLAIGSQTMPHGFLIQKFGFCAWDWVDPSRPVSEWLDTLDRVRPDALHCYPSALRELCLAAQKCGGLSFTPTVLSVGGELYPEEMDPLVLNTFGKLPIQMYGAMEGGRIAYQCHNRRGLHIRLDALDVEILKEGKDVAPGETGEIVITSFINTAMPFIRYRLGDLASLETGPCDCGLFWPRVNLHQGRQGDVLALPDGRRIPIAYLGAIVGKSQSISQFQFVQTSRDTLTLNYETVGGINPPVRPIHESLSNTLPGVAVHLKRVDRIKRTKTGKVACFVKKDE